MTIRRIVTAARDGKSILESDRPIDEGGFQSIPGFAVAIMWGTEGVPDRIAVDPTSLLTLLPPRGGSRFLIVSFPPDAAFADPAFDGSAALAEQQSRLADLAARFETDNSGMHRTDTLDYAIVLAGTPVLELDDGVTARLSPGDTVIQNATRHAWRNPGSIPATIAFIMLGNSSAPLA